MPLNPARARQLLKEFNFRSLFIDELGWDRHSTPLEVALDGQPKTLQAIAQKRGMVAYHCPTPAGESLPEYATRRKIEHHVAKAAHEHLIVFTDAGQTTQIWQWVKREPGKPAACREHTFHKSQPGDALLQKLQAIVFTLDEEETLSLTDVTRRARAGFDVERVTKRFYDQFQKEHTAFLKFIEGIAESADREWYASVMLNRLMFVYFIQRKGFLDGDPEYLRHRLNRCQEEKGKDKFYSFYRYFLLRLFHEGLGKRPRERAPDLEKLLGRIPYLNGGFFEQHQVEQLYTDIQIPDRAFERIFDYFDQYQWHLDERPLRADNEINPDVLGFIFEKYINQKQMGAYYTKEDITEYISKSTVIPFLFDAARKQCRIAFEAPGSAGASPAAVGALADGSAPEVRNARARSAAPEGGCAPHPTVWDLLAADPDRYIYPAVRHGVDQPLPQDIAAGERDVSRRGNWNRPAPGEYALPTEIWREVVARRKRCFELRARLTGQPLTPALSPSDGERENRSPSPGTSGASSSPNAAVVSPSPPSEGGEGRGEVGVPCSPIRDINELITLNLDIRQFAQDVIENCEGPELLRAFWHAIAGSSGSQGVTILDPTCGSGAFLFAALNVLEPLYEACLDRMEAFVEDLDRASSFFPPSERGEGRGEVGGRSSPKKFSDFRKVLERVDAHPNRRYFIFKSIILNNLFGVDIMEEAVEICKLRLFLKLAAQVEPDATKDNLGIEPLPDIDFNIRAGNTLVGYATAEEVRRCMTQFGGGQMRLGVDDELQSFARFTDKLQIADAAFRAFRQQQTELGGAVTARDKAELEKKLKALENELNGYLANEYGVKPNDKEGFARWVKSHQPFHWFVEFYGIVSNGGFDVIIGNPPYVVNTPEKVPYEIKQALFATHPCKNLYAFVCERSVQLAHKNSSLGLIVQLTALSSEKMQALQDLLLARGMLVAPSFPRRPESIFDGVEMPVTILFSRSAKVGMYTSRISRFYTEERPKALNVLALTRHNERLHGHRLGKFGSALEVEISRKLATAKLSLESLATTATEHALYYQEACRYWVKACKGYPFFRRNGEAIAPPHGRTMTFATANAAAFATCLVNSTLFYWFYSAFSDCEHINDALIRTFKIPESWNDCDWGMIEKRLARSLKENSQKKTITTKQGHKIEYEELDAAKSKPIIDEIDRVLAQHYGFTDEELDFILNYDIKYRLGLDGGGDEE